MSVYAVIYRHYLPLRQNSNTPVGHVMSVYDARTHIKNVMSVYAAIYRQYFSTSSNNMHSVCVLAVSHPHFTRQHCTFHIDIPRKKKHVVLHSIGQISRQGYRQHIAALDCPDDRIFTELCYRLHRQSTTLRYVTCYIDNRISTAFGKSSQAFRNFSQVENIKQYETHPHATALIHAPEDQASVGDLQCTSR